MAKPRLTIIGILSVGAVVILAAFLNAPIRTVPPPIASPGTESYLAHPVDSFAPSVSRDNLDLGPRSSGTASPVPTNSMPAPTGWKTYASSLYGFQFEYPNTWTEAGRDPRITDIITNPSSGPVLSISVVSSSEPLVAIAEEHIRQNNCSDENGESFDHVIKSTTSGVLYVLHCSATTEGYNYIFRTSAGFLVRLVYENDFKSDWPLEKKLQIFNRIIESARIY